MRMTLHFGRCSRFVHSKILLSLSFRSMDFGIKPPPKTYILGRKGRIRNLKVIIFILIFLAFSPFIIGFGMMKLEGIITGISRHEGNSIFGVLPWFLMFTIPLFMTPAFIISSVALLLYIRDKLVLGRER